MTSPTHCPVTSPSDYDFLRGKCRFFYGGCFFNSLHFCQECVPCTDTIISGLKFSLKLIVVAGIIGVSLVESADRFAMYEQQPLGRRLQWSLETGR
jgi:hypothetical protein